MTNSGPLACVTAIELGGNRTGAACGDGARGSRPDVVKGEPQKLLDLAAKGIVRLVIGTAEGDDLGVETPEGDQRGVSYKGHRYLAEIIGHCVWLYHRFRAP